MSARGLAGDPDVGVRRIVATRLPKEVAARMANDACWEVRWEVAQRASRAVAERPAKDPEDDVRAAACFRLAELDMPCVRRAKLDSAPNARRHGEAPRKEKANDDNVQGE
jgi:hypothetical protein